MHKIITYEYKKPEHELTFGLMADIEPPVNLDREAVSRFVRNGDLYRETPSQILLEGILVGSSDNHTAIYAPISTVKDNYDIEQILLGDRVSGLLEMLGIHEIEIEYSK